MVRIPFVLSVLSLIILATSCSFPKHKVRYEVNCTKCEVSYIKEKDVNVLRETATNSWSYEFLAYKGQHLSLAASNLDTLKDKVAVFIYLNGSLVDSLSKSGKAWNGASLTYVVE